jgi:inhibitor of KinA sporulation pathway (predicted exonuclease)
MKKVYHRFYSDYLLPNRMNEYSQINQLALDNGYTFKTTLEFYRNTVLEKIPQQKIFVHRHDIDTDIKTARRFFEVEQKLNIKTSYYFRLNTIDIGLMKEIAAAGHEVGYHYEELAQYCKDFKIKTWEKALEKMPEIQKRFENNFKNLESKLGFKIKSIASHGDFVNRILGHPNHELITDNLMRDSGIELECYNKAMMQHFDVLLSDQPYPKYYRDKSPREAIAEKVNVIYLLTHTRHWHVARWENTTDNIQRMWEGIRFKL